MDIFTELKKNLSGYETCFRFVEQLKTTEIQSLMENLENWDLTEEQKKMVDKAIAELRFSFGAGGRWLD